MKNEDFEKDLKNQIKHVFEDYDDGFAEEGWNLLRKKYPEKNRRKIIFWFTGIAAALLLIALLIWFFQTENSNKSILKSTLKQQIIRSRLSGNNKLSSSKSILKNHFTDSNAVKKDDVKTALDSSSKTSFALNKNKQVTTSNFDYAEKTSVKTVSKLTRQPSHQSVKTGKVTEQINPAKAAEHTVFTGLKTVAKDSLTKVFTDFNLVLADSFKKEIPVKITASKKPDNTNAANYKKTNKLETVKKLLTKTSKFNFGIFAGAHFNFANGSHTKSGFGGGFYTDYQLIRKLKISTGLNLIQNNLSYQNSFSNNSLSAVSSNSQLSVSTSVTGTSNTYLTKLNVGLLQLDIPINVTYAILPAKNSITISAGFSSGTFAKEAYQYQYLNATSDTEISKSFQSFYLMKTLNMALEFQLPFKKYNLQVEPFMKVAIGNTTTQQLKYGAAGINLKLNFQSFKK